METEEKDELQRKVEEINEALKFLPSDELRYEALDGICGRCGAVIGDGRCWGCYESPNDY